jgi:AcrR family transcriptional regulator
MTRVTKPVDERRAEIISKAGDLFFRVGFDKTQIADIAEEMGVASGLIYHYFPSKTQLLYAVIDEFSMEKAKQHAETIEQNTTATARECLEQALFNHMPPFPMDDIEEIPIFNKDPAIKDYCKRKMITNGEPILVKLINRGNDDGSWKCEHPKETAFFILHTFCGLVELVNPRLENGQSKLDIYKNITLRLLGV